MTDAEEAIEAIGRARDTAMRFTVEARIPECGKFGEIAQDLDAALAVISAVPQPPQEPTPEAVERAAIALYVARCSALGRTEENWRRMADEHRVGYLFDARTALAAALTAPA
jgi:hypothetical protein